ncbi:MAG: cupin domain-containing protein [Candidatus Bathyarchaeia archaeon]
MSAFFMSAADVTERKSPPPLSGRSAKILIDPTSEPSHRGALLSLVMFKYRPGQEGPLHSHEDSAEIYFTIRGAGLVKIGDKTYDAKPMSVLYIPAKTIHQPCNLGCEDWVFIAIFVPPIDLSEIRKWESIKSFNTLCR